MLVLKRKLGEKIYIDGGRIVLQLVASGSGWAKFGLQLPRSVSVLRDDICPEGPSRCHRCGGELPPAGPDGVRVAVSGRCQGECDPADGRCQAFAGSPLWGDAAALAGREDGAA